MFKRINKHFLLCIISLMATQGDLSLYSRCPNFSSTLLFFIFIYFSVIPSSAVNYISSNYSLSGNQTITSAGGDFALGFFQSGKGTPNRYYIGIWFNKVPKLTSIWVANRDTPIPDPAAAQLKISDDGNLVLLSQSRTQVLWSTNITSMASNSTVAEILDSGNLVLRDRSDPSKLLWQSFDHPTDTWLPGAEFVLNKVTRKGHVLTSWRNSDDPAAGLFSLELDPTGIRQVILLWNMSEQYWSTGPWNGHFFSSIPEMTAYRENPTVVNVSVEFFSNSTTNYFVYQLRGDMITRTVIDVSGQLKQLAWVEAVQDWIQFLSLPKQQCDVFAVCGPFGSCNENGLPFCNCVEGFGEKSPGDWKLGDRSQGCARNTPLQCGNYGSADGTKDWFLAVSSTRLPDDPHATAAASAEECELFCLDNCSCTAFYYYNGGCSVWYGGLLNLQEPSDGYVGETLYVRLAASELPRQPRIKKRTALKFVVVGVAIVLALLAFALAIFLVRRRRRRHGSNEEAEGNLVVFRYGDLQRMTRNFSERLGGGGFGSVYKGTLPDSTSIAVKKLRGLHRQGEKQFRSEVSTLGMIQHVNLVRLRGFCSEGNNRLLVYDYMTKGSLNAHLFRRGSPAIDWNTRYNIAIGTARGLAYLHEQCRDCIIHCDVKPENILLDESFHPKLADFGLAKLVGRDFSKVLTTMRGTVGYLAPEWISGEAITPKADTYSYGMTLLELVSGRRNREQPGEDSPYFPVLAAREVIEGNVLSLLDPRLNANADLTELERACKVACWCIQDDEAHRPSMAQVVQILEGALEVEVAPIPRALQVLADDQNTKCICIFSETSSGQSSMKTLSGWSSSQMESCTSEV
ncbi:unnamed protein product [Musa hybrid cultivar]